MKAKHDIRLLQNPLSPTDTTIINKALEDARQAGIREVVDYFSRHWMGQTRGMLLYEIPTKDRDLLEDGIVPNQENGE